MTDRETHHIEQSSKALPSSSDQEDAHDDRKGQESSHDFQPLHPAATPTRAQQQRHRRNLRLNGQVDIEKGSLPRHAFREDRRDSWIDRINSSTKDAIRRTSVIAAVDEKKWIDKVADSINDYGDQHKEDSWTDKVMNFLFPSMGLESSLSTNSEEKENKKINETSSSPFDNGPPPAMTPSDINYDQTQRMQPSNDRKSWSANTTDTRGKVEKTAMNQHPHTDMKAEISDQAYDDSQADLPEKRPAMSYADVTQNGDRRSSSSSSTSSWSLFNEYEDKSNHEEQQLDFDNTSQWPPL